MHLFTAFVPPKALLEDVHRVVAAVRPAPLTSKSRFGRRTEVEQSIPFRQTSLERMHVPFSILGNMTRGDARTFAAELSALTRVVPPPRLRLAGGTALEWPSDRAVWVRLDGDLEALQDLAGTVNRVAQSQNLYVDRRRFHPMLSVGEITDDTTEQYLEDLVAALAAFAGAPWSLRSISLMRSLAPGESGGDTFSELENIPLMR